MIPPVLIVATLAWNGSLGPVGLPSSPHVSSNLGPGERILVAIPVPGEPGLYHWPGEYEKFPMSTPADSPAFYPEKQ